MSSISNNIENQQAHALHNDHVFVDSIRLNAPCHNDTPVGRQYRLDPLQDPQAEPTFGWLSVTGPFGLPIQVKSAEGYVGESLSLRICLPKALQGHNLFSSSDWRWLCYEAIQWTADELGLAYTQEDWSRWLNADFFIPAIHIVGMLDLETNENVEAAVDLLRVSLRSRHARFADYGSTLFYGPDSDYWSLKLYNKSAELQKKGRAHALPSDIPCRSQLTRFAKGKLRVELELKKKALLAEGLTRASDWNAVSLAALLRSYLARLYYTDRWELPGEVLANMSRQDRFAYAAWRQYGHLDFLTPSTFKNYRDSLLRLGIDLKVPFAEDGEQLKKRLGGRCARELLALPFCGAPSDLVRSPVYKSTIQVSWYDHPKILDSDGKLLKQPDPHLTDTEYLELLLQQN